MIHKSLFSTKSTIAKSTIAFLIAILLASIVAMPAFATGGVINTSGYGDGYYYECTYTPAPQMASHHYGKGHYYVDGYHVACTYTDVVKKQANHGKNKHHGHHGHHGHHKHCVHTVQQGDNLSSIAAHYGTTFTRLAQKNHLEYPYYLYVGNVLKVPCRH